MGDESNRPISTQQQLVETIIKLDLRLDEQAAHMKNQDETIRSLQKQLGKATLRDTEESLSGKSEQNSFRERLPTLEKFIGDRSIWDEWHLAALHKLLKDGIAIGDDFDQFMYIYSRLEGEAAKMVSTMARALSTDRKGNGYKFIEYLNTVFGDPNKKARAQQELYSMKQREKESFASFLPKFETTLATAGWSGYADEQKVSLIKNALWKEMRTALIGKSLPQVWAECISELLTISSEIIAINNQFRPQVASISNFPKPPDPSSMDWEPIKSTTTGTKQIEERRAKWVKKETLAFRKKNKLCVRCGWS